MCPFYKTGITSPDCDSCPWAGSCLPPNKGAMIMVKDMWSEIAASLGVDLPAIQASSLKQERYAIDLRHKAMTSDNQELIGFALSESSARILIDNLK